MVEILALLIALDLKAEDKGKPRPSVHVLEALRVFAGSNNVIDLRGPRTSPTQRIPCEFSEAADAAYEFLSTRLAKRG